MGTLYAAEMWGLSPMVEDPTAKYWGVSTGKGKGTVTGSATTASILKYTGFRSRPLSCYTPCAMPDRPADRPRYTTNT